MEKYLQLQASLIEQADAIVALGVAGDRDITSEELGQVTDLLSQAEEAGVKASTLQALADKKLEVLAPQPKVVGATSHVTKCEPAIESDPKRGFESFSEFAHSIVAAATPNAGVDGRLDVYGAATGLNQTTGADGGFDVPPEFETKIWDGLNAQPDNLLAKTDQYTLTHTESLTLNANAETSRANGSRYGGIAGNWIAEADLITSSKPGLRQIALEPEEYAVLVYATDKLLRNGTAMEQFLTRASTDEIGFAVSDAIMNGDGVAKPLGILGHASVVDVAKETAQPIGTIVYENITKMWSRCHARARAKSAWYVNQDCEPELFNLQDSNGNSVYLPGGNLAGAPFATLFGRPVIPTEYNASIGNSGDIMLGNFDYYATALRSGGVRAASSIHLRFDYAETAFRFMFACDGLPWLAAPLTPKNGTNTLSPFVTLADRLV